MKKGSLSVRRRTDDLFQKAVTASSADSYFTVF